MRCDCCPACCAAHAQGQCPQDAPVYNAPIALYSGITLTFLHYIDMDLATLPALPADALALHFCLTGRAGFALPEGGTRYLGDGEALLCLGGERTLTSRAKIALILGAIALGIVLAMIIYTFAIAELYYGGVENMARQVYGTLGIDFDTLMNSLGQ